MINLLRLGTYVLCVAGLSLAGCGGPSKVQIKGKLTKNGEPLKVSKSTQVTLTFAEDVKGGAKQTYPATFSQSEGTFEVEMPPGKYRVGLVIFDHEKSASIPVKISDAPQDLTTNKEIIIEISK